jgi:hypothetical protein
MRRYSNCLYQGSIFACQSLYRFIHRGLSRAGLKPFLCQIYFRIKVTLLCLCFCVNFNTGQEFLLTKTKTASAANGQQQSSLSLKSRKTKMFKTEEATPSKRDISSVISKGSVMNILCSLLLWVIIIIYLNCKWGFPRWQCTTIRHNTQITHRTQTKHSTQNYTNNQGHTTHNESQTTHTMNTITTTTNTGSQYRDGVESGE